MATMPILPSQFQPQRVAFCFRPFALWVGLSGVKAQLFGVHPSSKQIILTLNAFLSPKTLNFASD